jgi:hypothetical protein
MEVDSYS